MEWKLNRHFIHLLEATWIIYPRACTVGNVCTPSSLSGAAFGRNPEKWSLFVREGAMPLYLRSQPGTTVRTPPHTVTQLRSSKTLKQLKKVYVEIINIQIIILKMPFE